MRFVRRTLAAALLSSLLPCLVPAQSLTPVRRATITVAAGLSQWDLSGTGNSLVVAVRADKSFGPSWLLGEASVTTFRPLEGSETSTYMIPEVQLQVQAPGRIAPYLGAGGGAVYRIRQDEDRVDNNGNDRSDLTLSAAGGVRVWGLIPSALLRLELRVRGVGATFSGSTAEWTGGIGWAF